jgi:hypothetical protein
VEGIMHSNMMICPFYSNALYCFDEEIHKPKSLLATFTFLVLAFGSTGAVKSVCLWWWVRDVFVKILFN